MVAEEVGLLQISGFIAVVLTGIWMGHYRGGFAWTSDPDHQFNWHPLLMMLGMVYLYGNGKETWMRFFSLYSQLSFC